MGGGNPPAGGRPLLVALRPLGLGDYLTGVPALRALRAAFPRHRLVLATSPALLPLARHVGHVDEVVGAIPLEPLDASLAAPDVAVDLHGRGPGSQRVLLGLGGRRLVSFAHPGVPATAGSPQWRPDEHEVARWCRMLSESGIPADPSRLGIPAPGAGSPAPARGATLVHPGAASASRRWPPRRFAAVARAEEDGGRRVLVTGGPGEFGLAGRVAAMAGLPAGRVVAGRTGLLGLVATVAAAGAVVSGDTGVAHVATAVGTPSVVLCGPVPPAEWGPPPGRPWHQALWAGRRGDPHGTAVDPGLMELGVGDALAALERARAAATSGRP